MKLGDITATAIYVSLFAMTVYILWPESKGTAAVLSPPPTTTAPEGSVVVYPPEPIYSGRDTPPRQDEESHDVNKSTARSKGSSPRKAAVVTRAASRHKAGTVVRQRPRISHKQKPKPKPKSLIKFHPRNQGRLR